MTRVSPGPPWGEPRRGHHGGCRGYPHARLRLWRQHVAGRKRRRPDAGDGSRAWRTVVPGHADGTLDVERTGSGA